MTKNGTPRTAPPYHPFAGLFPEEVLPTGSEMGALLRSIDWTTSPLGSPEQWPPALRTMVGVMLGTRHPMAVWWGGECLHLYNDAYRLILGDKHPAALGAPGAAVWGKSWRLIGPMAQGVLDGKGATWDEDFLFPIDRRGFLEEMYFTFSYSPIPDDDGRVGGVLVTTRETTREVVERRQLKTLRDLAAHSTLAKSAEEAFAGATRTLAENDADLPFVLLYLVDGASSQARLTATSLTGDPLAQAAAPEAWPLAQSEAVAGPLVVGDLAARVGPMPGGRWSEAPDRAVVVALARPGLARPYGYLVSGVSPHRLLDEAYLGFFERIGEAIVSTVVNALSYQEERRRAEALAELDRAKTSFFSNISHELRTPLTLMLGPAEDLLGGAEGELTAPQRAQLGLVHRNGLRLQRLVNTLLDFSRLEAGRLQAAFEPVDLAALTRDLAASFRAVAERAGLELIIDCPPLDEPIFVDPDLWERIVLNLLSNAFKFTFEGRIEVSLRAGAREAVLRVRDTGIGIRPEDLPRLFRRFERLEGARGRTHEGSGLGLVLVQELVRLHGGSVGVESEHGAGTAFTVTLPRGSAHLPREQLITGRGRSLAAGGPSPLGAAFAEELAAMMAPDEPPGGEPSEPKGESDPGHILIADDNADMRSYLRRILEPRWTVTAAADGDAALAAARAHRPDVILTDVMMPALDGFALLERLRADPATTAIPVIMLSARAGEASRVEGLEAGADDYLVKPFSARELLARVATQLKLVRSRKALEKELAFSELFVAMLGHDLRNPLGGILSSIELILHREEHERLAAPLRRIRASAQRMTRMIEQLLDFACARLGGDIPIAPAEVDLRSLALQPIEELEAGAPGRIVFESLGDARGEWDGDRLGQVLSNLLGNALEHGAPGEPVWLRLDGSDDDAVRIDVTSAGAIPERSLPDLFDPFRRAATTEPPSRPRGLGLGLYIVQQIIFAHDGAISVRSADNRTTFSITLPRRAPRRPPAVSAADTRRRPRPKWQRA